MIKSGTIIRALWLNKKNAGSKPKRPAQCKAHNTAYWQDAPLSHHAATNALPPAHVTRARSHKAELGHAPGLTGADLLLVGAIHVVLADQRGEAGLRGGKRRGEGAALDGPLPPSFSPSFPTPSPPRHLERRFQLVHQRVVGIAGPRRRRDEAGRPDPAGRSGRRGSRRLVGEHPAQRARHGARLLAADRACAPRPTAEAGGSSGAFPRRRREKAKAAGGPARRESAPPALPSPGPQVSGGFFATFRVWVLVSSLTAPPPFSNKNRYPTSRSVCVTHRWFCKHCHSSQEHNHRWGHPQHAQLRFPSPPPRQFSLNQNTLCKIYCLQELRLLHTYSISHGHSLVLNTSGRSSSVFLL